MEEQSSTESLCQLASKGDPEADTCTPTIFERVLGVHSMSGMCSAHCAVTIVQNCVSAVLVGEDVILSEDGMFGDSGGIQFKMLIKTFWQRGAKSDFGFSQKTTFVEM